MAVTKFASSTLARSDVNPAGQLFFHTESPMSHTSFLEHFFFAAALTGFSAALTWVLLHRLQILDHPNERSSHTSPVPRSGGIAIVVAFLAGIFAIFLFGDQTQITQKYFLGFIVSALCIALVSFYDDITSQSHLVRLTTQVAAVAVVLAFGIVVDELSLPWFGSVKLGWIGYVISFIWIVGLTNAYNFMDGLDGLAAGVAVIVCVFFAYITFQQGSLFIYITSYALLAGALGFLVFNLSPARIFMGDVGSVFLGFVLAVMAIVAARYDHSHTSFLVMPLLLFNFIYDTAFTFFRRLQNREKVTQAHRTHLYQLCNQLGWSHRQVSFAQYGMCVLQGFAAIWMVQAQGEYRGLVFLPFLILYSVYSAVVMRKARQAGLIA